MFCNSCGTQLADDATFCPNCGNAVNAAAAQPVLGLKWAHFLSYFALWLGAVANVVMCILVFTGALYEAQDVPAELVYSFFPGLQPLNYFYGVCLIVMAVLGVITAVSINKYMRRSGTLVCSMYLASAIISCIYLIGTSVIIGQFAMDSSAAASIIVGIVMFFVNRIYFKNRENIFVN